jgi:hypothetical protein
MGYSGRIIAKVCATHPISGALATRSRSHPRTTAARASRKREGPRQMQDPWPRIERGATNRAIARHARGQGTRWDLLLHGIRDSSKVRRPLAR